MARDISLRLQDIVEACQQIEEYILDYDFNGFAEDQKTSDAVIRQFEIIGEAVKAVPPEMRERESEVPWQNIAGFRDVLSHAYHAVDLLTVWDAATSKLPAVRAAVERLLDAGAQS